MTTMNVHGNSGDESRGTWCTPKWLCELMGEFDLDPCANERSHVKAIGRYALPRFDGLSYASTTQTHKRVFINPPYSQGQVIKWIEAYAHTDFTFLLRWDPSTAWFRELVYGEQLYGSLTRARFAWFPVGRRINFEAPPGVKASSSMMPHALYMKNEPNAALKKYGLTVELK